MTSNYTTLYVIGNGFDIHHGIKSSYKNYLDWLKENHDDIYQKIIGLYDDADKLEWWNEFETNLGYFDIRTKIEDIAFQNQPSDDDLEKMRIDTMAGAWDAQEEIGEVLDAIKSTFHQWVDSLSQANSSYKIELDSSNAFFINFNYSLTLENLYGINPLNILHIHGSLVDGEYIIGHGRSYDDVREDAEPYIPDFNPNTDDPSEYGIDEMDNEITENTKKEAVDQVMELAKNTNGIIKNNQSTFEKLENVTKVFIYGLSFSPVDEPYLDHIIKSVSPDADYEISYYSETDKLNISDYLDKIGIKANFVKLEDIQVLRQMKLF